MEKYYLTMRNIIKAVDRPVGAPESFIPVVVFCKYCDFERCAISEYGVTIRL